MTTATIKNYRNGTVSIHGLTRGDLRLIALAVEEGSFAGGDHGGDVSKALLRLAHLLRVPSSFPTLHAPVTFTCGTADASELYEETT
jgi:hypothetical protein